MKMLSKSFKIDRTKSGGAAAWECGGFGGSTGTAQIVADKSFNKKSPLFFNRNEDINGKHCLFRMEVGDIIGLNYVSNNKDHIAIYSITKLIDNETDVIAEGKAIWVYSNGEWTQPTIEVSNVEKESITNFIKALRQKARIYSCTHAIYA